jgi:hypothetical protein
MRLGLAVISAAAVIGGYALVDSVASRPADASFGSAPAAGEEGGWMPRLIDEPEPETRSYELIRYMNEDGSFGMTDDPRRVPPGARILGRERKTVTVAKPVVEPEWDERLDQASRPPPGAGRKLSGAEQRLMEKLLETGPFPDAHQLEQMQGDLDELERERASAERYTEEGLP